MPPKSKPSTKNATPKDINKPKQQEKQTKEAKETKETKDIKQTQVKEAKNNKKDQQIQNAKNSNKTQSQKTNQQTQKQNKVRSQQNRVEQQNQQQKHKQQKQQSKNNQDKQQNKNTQENQQITKQVQKQGINKQQHKPQVPQELSSYDELNKQIKQFQEKLQSHQKSKIQRTGKNKEQLQNLHDIIEYNNAKFLQKIEELKRQETFHLKLGNIQPEIPQNFPKNYCVQLSYQDINFRSNPKFLDFDENIIEQKFIFPLLPSSTVKVQIIIPQKGEQQGNQQSNKNQQNCVFDKVYINLQEQIGAALNSKKKIGQSAFENNPQLKITHEITLQGIGFQSWLKNIQMNRHLQQQKIIQAQQRSSKIQRSVQKIAERKKRFSNQFNTKSGTNSKLATKKYGQQQVNSILNLLYNDE